MAKWTFEPGHTAAEFSARHMMVTNVRGHFKNVHGTLDFDPEKPSATSVEVTIDARGLWSGELDRDARGISRHHADQSERFRRQLERHARPRRPRRRRRSRHYDRCGGDSRRLS